VHIANYILGHPVYLVVPSQLSKTEIKHNFNRRTIEIKQNAETAVKRFTCFRRAVLHMESAYCWNVSAFYFTYCATAEISSIRNGIHFTFHFSFISSVRATPLRYTGWPKK